VFVEAVGKPWSRESAASIIGRILVGNLAMLHVSQKVGFSLRFNALTDEWLADLRF
jgi:hypothetical protein